MNDRPNILIVDDVEANLIAMEALLGDLECNIVRAGSGNEALRHLLKCDFAAVLLDVQMPEMDGFEVARLARLNPRSREVPIIFVTAMLETEESLFLGYESGAVDVLFKPLNAHVLVSKVQVFLEVHRSRQRLADEIEAHKGTLADLEAFNYSVSHDLRAPLRPLRGFSEILLESHGDKLDDEGRRLLARISSAAERMEQLIDDLLRLSKVSKKQLSLQVVDLSQIANGIIAELRSQDPGRVLEVVIAPALEARGYAILLRIALDNLLRNAWKFTGRIGGGEDRGRGGDFGFEHQLLRPGQRRRVRPAPHGQAISTVSATPLERRVRGDGHRPRDCPARHPSSRWPHLGRGRSEPRQRRSSSRCRAADPELSFRAWHVTRPAR